MIIAFFVAAVVAILASVMVITRRNAVHALLYLIVSFFSIGLIFFLLGAPFIAALEVIVYAGAIMVLFLFVMMMLNVGKASEQQEAAWFDIRDWIGPLILTGILLGELIYVLSVNPAAILQGTVVQPKDLGRVLFSQYFLAVEFASMILLSGLVGAFHLGRRREKPAP